MKILLYLLLVTPVFYIQNMVFTWVSRSRNSGDPNYHRIAAIFSNLIWFICQAFVFKLLWVPLMNGDFLVVVIGGIAYVIATTEGSVLMMKVLLGKVNIPIIGKYLIETGKKKVGER